MIYTLYCFLWKEITQTFRDRRMKMALFYIPLFQLLVYGFALSSYTSNVKLAIVMRPDDAFMRRVARRFYESRWFIEVAPDGSDPVDWLRSGRAEAVLIASLGGSTRDIGRGRAAFELLVDSADAVRARSIDVYARSIVAQALRDEGYDRGGGRFDFALRTFFNPERRTSVYLIPGTICVLLFLAVTALTSMSMGRERELGTIETLLSAPISRWELLIGKTLPFVALGMLELPFGLLFARLVGVPILGSIPLIFLATLIFLCCAVCGGFLMSMSARNQQQAVLTSFLFNFPAVQFSGIIFPVENMPKAIAWLAYLNPLHYYVDVMRHLLLKGNDWAAVAPKLGAMAGLGVVGTILVSIRYRQTVN